MNRAAASQPHGEGFIIGITKRHHFCSRPLAQHLERFGHHGTFDTTTTHRADHFAVFVHRHGCARVARARAINAHHAANYTALVGLTPAINVVEQVTHRRAVHRE